MTHNIKFEQYNLARWLINVQVVVLLTCVCVTNTRAEVFYLKTGGSIEGKLLNPTETPRTQFIIETDYGQIVLRSDTVTKVSVKSDLLRQYEELAVKLENTVEAHLDMAQKCGQANLREQREYHLKHVLKLDPNNERARKLLGYSMINGQWRKYDVWMKEQGYLQYKGRWYTPQEYASVVSFQEAKDKELQWKKKVDMLLSSIQKNKPDAKDALREIREIRDYHASITFARRLTDDKEKYNRDTKLLFFEVLCNIGGKIPEEAIIQCAIGDPDSLLRQRSMEKLREWQSRRAMNYFLGQLKSKNNAVVNDAGYYLGELGMSDAVLPLISSLQTKHQFQVGGGNNVNAGFSPNGGNPGFTFGGKAKLVERDIQNPKVRTALLSMVPQGVDYAFDEDAWKKWFSRATTPANVNLRRGN